VVGSTAVMNNSFISGKVKYRRRKMILLEEQNGLKKELSIKLNSNR
jgi:hypothetical protein